MSMNTIEVTKQQLVDEFNSVVAETEQLLKTVASAGGDKAGAMRASVEQNLAMAKERLRDLQHMATEKAGAAAHATDEYVHSNPWQAIGVAAGVGAVVGALIGLSLNRR